MKPAAAQIATTKAINIEMLERIRQAHFVVVCLPDHNANVYYEAGFATALNKFLLLFSFNPENLPFDIRANRVFPIADGANEMAKNDLLAFMNGLRSFRN